MGPSHINSDDSSSPEPKRWTLENKRVAQCIRLPLLRSGEWGVGRVRCTYHIALIVREEFVSITRTFD